MRRILLVTIVSKSGHGNILQNYALQTVLQELGFEVTNLVHPPIDVYSGFIYSFKGFIKHILASMGVKEFSRKIKADKLRKQRREKCGDFYDEVIVSPVYIERYNHLNRISTDMFEFAITGSDQVWHKWHHGTRELEYFYLTFMPKSKRIAYAPSFGFSSFPAEDVEIHKTGLLGITRLSCREKKGAELINNLIGIYPEVVLDPALLLNKYKWTSLKRKPSVHIPDNYLLLYFLGQKTNEQEKYFKYLASKYRLEIIDINSVDFEELYSLNPAEFIWVVENAAFVCTDSFHGVVFSILFHKQFQVFKRKGKGVEDMFDRIESLLEITGLTNSIYGNSDLNTIDFDWDAVDNILGNERIKSIKYLQESLCCSQKS